MAMPVAEYNRLRKLMMMTNSESDQEVLTAVRSANAILKKHNYDWNSAFDRIVKVSDGHPEVEEAPPERTLDDERRDIEQAFEDVGEPDGSFGEFIESLKEQFRKRGTLTVNQKDALFRAQNRALRR